MTKNVAPALHITQLSAPNADQIYALTETGIYARQIAGGVSWRLLTDDPIVQTLVSIAAVTPDRTYALDVDGNAYVFEFTSGSGRAWRKLHNPTTLTGIEAAGHDLVATDEDGNPWLYRYGVNQDAAWISLTAPLFVAEVPRPAVKQPKKETEHTGIRKVWSPLAEGLLRR